MILIRLAHAAVMPTPADLIRKLEKTHPGSEATPAQTATESSAPLTSSVQASSIKPAAQEPAESTTLDSQESKESPDPEPEPVPSAASEVLNIESQEEQQSAQPERPPSPQSLRELVRLFEDQGELLLAATIKLKMRPIKFDDGHFEFDADGSLENGFPEKIARLLWDWTGIKWIIARGDGASGPTLDEQDAAKRQEQIDAISSHPLVEKVLTTFPGAKVEAVEDITPPDAIEIDDEDDDSHTGGVVDHA
jgi:DNA polymerase-3 subunit gamma/tau